MILYIKNMVCDQCKLLLAQVLEDVQLTFKKIELGSVELTEPITRYQRERLKSGLILQGLKLLEDSKELLVEKIKTSIINMVHNDTAFCSIKTSCYLSDYLRYNYTYLANVFSEETGTCLRDFIIAHKIEKAKQMLVYDNLTVTEIAWKLNYSSVAHLSNQFTKITGCSPRQFKKSTTKIFIPFAEIGLLSSS